MRPPTQDPPSIELRIAAASSWYHREPFQAYQLQNEFQKYYEKWWIWNKPSYPEAIYYAENKIIKNTENELDHLVFHDLQEAPWPEDHDPKINHNMQTATNNFHF